VNHQKLRTNGIGIQVEDHGSAEQAVLFLHFGGANLRMWDPVLPYFTGKHRCITLDLRGHGLSDAPSTGYHIDDMAKDVAGVLNALDAVPVHIVGSSMGAEVGLALAAHHPELVRSFVADGAFESEYGPYSVRKEASLAEDEETGSWLESRRQAPEKQYENREVALETLNAFYKKHEIWNPSVEAMLSYGLVQDGTGRVVTAWRKWADDQYMEHYFKTRFEDYYGRLACPTIVLTGKSEEADPVGFDIIMRLCGLAEQCEPIHTPGAVHPYGWMLNPEPMVRAVLEFHRRLA
jgi:pimeloyl-ACP methyl ester carboxylesterase